MSYEKTNRMTVDNVYDVPKKGFQICYNYALINQINNVHI